MNESIEQLIIEQLFDELKESDGENNDNDRRTIPAPPNYEEGYL